MLIVCDGRVEFATSIWRSNIMFFQTTRLSKAISAVLVLSYVVHFFVPDSSSYLALVPGRTLPCVWNLVSASFVVSNPLEVGQWSSQTWVVTCAAAPAPHSPAACSAASGQRGLLAGFGTIGRAHLWQQGVCECTVCWAVWEGPAHYCSLVHAVLPCHAVLRRACTTGRLHGVILRERGGSYNWSYRGGVGGPFLNPHPPQPLTSLCHSSSCSSWLMCLCARPCSLPCTSGTP